MGNLTDAGGCYNGTRYGLAPTANTRTWKQAFDSTVVAVYINSERAVFVACFDGDDMNAATACGFDLQWRNVTDAGSFADLAATGEIKWATDSNLVNGQDLVSAEAADNPSSVDCVNKGWLDLEGKEVEAALGVTDTVNDDVLYEVHWALNLEDADAINGDEYEFRILDEASVSFGTSLGKLKPIIEGQIEGTTKNADRSSAVGGVTVTVYESDGAGSDPKPIGAEVAQVVSHASLGTYTITGLASGQGYFMHFYKDDTADLSDGSPEVTAVEL
jgi:hypothetical protein